MYFSFDSEAFRALATIKQGLGKIFTKRLIGGFEESWDHSRKAFFQMIEHISELKPHDTKEIISLNRIKSLVSALTIPMVEIAAVLEGNKQELEDLKSELESVRNPKELHQKLQSYTTTSIVATPLPYPRTVCANEKCKRIIQVSDTGEFNFKYKTCHENCTEVRFENSSSLKRCSAFTRFGGFIATNCQTCDHSYLDHIQIQQEWRKAEVNLIPDEFLAEIKAEERELQAQKEKSWKEILEKGKEQEKEKDLIMKSAASFSILLKENALGKQKSTYQELISELVNLSVPTHP